MAESGPEIKEPQRKSLDPLEDEIRASFANEWDTISGRPDDPEKQKYIDRKTDELLDTADLIGRVEAKGGIDNLTKLPLRQEWDRELARALSLLEMGADVDVSVLMLDLDNFKLVNDKKGHKVGDVVLQATAAVLHGIRTSVRASDSVNIGVSRIGGEEMGVIIVNPRTYEKNPDERRKVTDPIKFANNLRERVTKTVAANTEIKEQTVSIGLTRMQRDPETGLFPTIDQIKEQADIALYNSKANGRNRVTEFQKGMIMPKQPATPIGKVA